jgi:hypothetical protein
MSNQDGIVKWKNLSGTFRMREGKRIIKPNETFDAHPDEIPKAFRDTVVPVNPESIVEPPLQIASGTYEIKSRGPGLYNVVDGQGKIVNEKGLSAQAAKELLETLSN